MRMVAAKANCGGGGTNFCIFRCASQWCDLRRTG